MLLKKKKNQTSKHGSTFRAYSESNLYQHHHRGASHHNLFPEILQQDPDISIFSRVI